MAQPDSQRPNRRWLPTLWGAAAIAGFGPVMLWNGSDPAGSAIADAGPAAAFFPDTPAPPENPITEPKRLLGKALFWDEQLSSDNTVACGTCHRPSAGTADPRLTPIAGPDGVLGSFDDVMGSTGVRLAGPDGTLLPHPVHGFDPQITLRAAPNITVAAFASLAFWDGRGPGRVHSPLDGSVVIKSGGALESQVLETTLSSVEMSDIGRTWPDVIAKLEVVRPLALASELTADLLPVVDAVPTYAELFDDAFGDPAITPGRVAMAVATYMRTLVPDQTPYDLFIEGDQGALTPEQSQGLSILLATRCTNCHVPPMFTDFSFRNIGLLADTGDTGRAGVTGNPADEQKFKVATLRNAGLKPTFFVTGEKRSIPGVLQHYFLPDPTEGIVDSNLPINLTDLQFAEPIAAFLSEGLVDPRTRSGEPPFDRPTLFSERQNALPSVIGGGRTGSADQLPEVVVVGPALVGSRGFRLGVRRALGASQSWVALSESPPTNGLIPEDQLFGPFPTGGAGAAQGFATWTWDIPDDPSLDGATRYAQWIIDDPEGQGGRSRSPVVRLDLFRAARDLRCPLDFNADGLFDFGDINAFIALFLEGDPAADLATDGVLDQGDLTLFVERLLQGC